MMKKGFYGLVVCLSLFAVVLCTGEASAVLVVSCNSDGTCPDDGLFCSISSCNNDNSLCESTSKCTGETPECDEEGDKCVECLTDGNCQDDGKFCTGVPTCNDDGVCGESGDPCVATDRLCNETGSECYDRPQCEIDDNCSQLDDGVFCNGPTICSDDFKCANAGSPCEGVTPECAENESGTGDCVECVNNDNCEGDTSFCVENVCVACEQDTDCYDDIFCNGVEQCADGACVAGTPVFCPDNLVCDEEYTGCVACLADADCVDDDFCNGAETCIDGACAAGTAVECAEGESCDEETDSCVADSECEVDDDCDDGLFCTGAETCVANACVDGPGDPCEEGETCDEQKEECVSSETCETDADCADDGLFCNGVEVCVVSAPAEGTPVEQGTCASTGNPCDAGETCNEENNTCEVVGPDGILQVSKCTVKAGKTDNSDSIQFLGLLDAKEADFTVGGDVVVSIEAPELNATTFISPVDAGSLKKGKYKSPKDTTEPVVSVQIDTNKGTVKFSAKKADLTGLGCPITVMVEIGAYSAEQELGEDIVNGPKKLCPPELLE